MSTLILQCFTGGLQTQDIFVEIFVHSTKMEIYQVVVSSLLRMNGGIKPCRYFPFVKVVVGVSRSEYEKK